MKCKLGLYLCTRFWSHSQYTYVFCFIFTVKWHARPFTRLLTKSSKGARPAREVSSRPLSCRSTWRTTIHRRTSVSPALSSMAFYTDLWPINSSEFAAFDVTIREFGVMLRNQYDSSNQTSTQGLKTTGETVRCRKLKRAKPHLTKTQTQGL